MKGVVHGIYAGAVGSFPADGTPTAIFKRPVHGPARFGTEGIAGDQQADRRVHGGPEKAVHHFVADHFPRLAARFPQAAAALVPGSIGENLSGSGLDETTVCIGDVFALGGVRLQVCQPRSPCWKMDARYGLTGLARFVSESCLSGWYYRVLEAGEAAAGDDIVLVDRSPQTVSLAAFWTAWRTARDAESLGRLAALPGLSSVFRRYLSERREQLGAGAAGDVPAFHARKG